MGKELKDNINKQTETRNNVPHTQTSWSGEVVSPYTFEWGPRVITLLSRIGASRTPYPSTVPPYLTPVPAKTLPECVRLLPRLPDQSTRSLTEILAVGDPNHRVQTPDPCPVLLAHALRIFTSKTRHAGVLKREVVLKSRF